MGQVADWAWYSVASICFLGSPPIPPSHPSLSHPFLPVSFLGIRQHNYTIGGLVSSCEYVVISTVLCVHTRTRIFAFLEKYIYELRRGIASARAISYCTVLLKDTRLIDCLVLYHCTTMYHLLTLGAPRVTVVVWSVI